jgi:O-antigen/teichoic acid export membrane protein
MDNVLIGRYYGADELGYYSRAYFLRTLPAMYASIAVTDLMVPALTALAGDRQRFGSAYREAIRLIAFVGCPLAALVAVTAPELVAILYGRRWGPVVPLLYWLSLPALVLPIYTSMGWIFIAVGKGRQMFFLSLITTPIVLAAYWIGISWGAWGIAVAAAALFTIPLPWFSLYCAHRAADISLRQTLHGVLPICVASVGMAAAAVTAGSFVAWQGGHWLLVLATKLCIGTSVYLCLTTGYVPPAASQMMERLRRLAGGIAGASGRAFESQARHTKPHTFANQPSTPRAESASEPTAVGPTRTQNS